MKIVLVAVSYFWLSTQMVFPAVAEDVASQEREFVPPVISVPEGFRVEVAAGPPLVKHPTMACLDDRGRLFVCENAGVNLQAKELESELPNGIKMLEDTNGDGTFDKATTFADKMTFPMGAAWLKGSLFVASPPNIWKLTDTNNDGVADKREKLVSEFGYTGNAASIHGCFNGPDGRLYWCDGYHGHEFRDETGTVASKREGSYLFSCKEDGSDVRIHCGGGMDNPVEVDFIETGEMLGTVNIMLTRPRVDCFVHWLRGGVYPHRERVLSETQSTGDWLQPTHHFGHVAVSGTTRYRSGLLNPKWKNNYFATFFNSGRVVRLELHEEGSTFRVQQREFLSSENRDFHPTDVLEDADGSLLVVDTGGWFYRGCPTSQLPKPDVYGAIYRIRPAKKTEVNDAWGTQIPWAKLSPTQLVNLLNDERHQVRERAINECGLRDQSIIRPLRTVLRNGNERQQLGAVWAITRQINRQGKAAGGEARATLRMALQNVKPATKQAACRALVSCPDPLAQELLIRLLNDESPAVRRQAASALGRLGQSEAVPALLTVLGNRVDRAEEHSILFALIEINAPTETRAGLTANSANVKRGTMIALDQMHAQLPGGNLTADDVLTLLDANDKPTRMAALKIVQARVNSAPSSANWVKPASQLLQKWFQSEAVFLSRQSVAMGLVSTFANDVEIGKLIGKKLNESGAIQTQLLTALAEADLSVIHPDWREPLERSLRSTDSKTVERAMQVIAGSKNENFRKQLQMIGTNSERPVLLRVAALDAAAGKRGTLTEPVFQLLLDLLTGQGTAVESVRAAQLMGTASLSTEQLIKVAPVLKNAGASELRELIRPFQRNSRPEVANAFLDAAEESRLLMTLPANELSDVVKRYPKELLPRANALLEKVRQYEEQRVAKVDQLIPQLSSGNAHRGKELFFNEKTKCATCHRVGEQGKRIGPDLTTIGQNRSPRDLLESIVFPSATIVRDFEPYSILQTDGRVVSGLIVRETRDLLEVQQQTGTVATIKRTQIEEITPGTVSMMPNGLEKALSEQDLADIIAWLMTLKQTGSPAP